MKPIVFMLMALSVCAQAGSGSFSTKASVQPPPALRDYNVVWDSPSQGSIDSMPLSGWNLGLNVWVEGNDILLLASSPNCQDERGMQVKLGLIRLRFDVPVFAQAFRQELRLEQSEIVISGKTADGKPLQVTLWCETGATVAHAQLVSKTPVGLTVSYETWSAYEAKVAGGGIQWVRRLPEVNPRREKDMKEQGMQEFAALVPDPLSKLTLGGRIDAPGLIPAESAPGTFNGMPLKVCADENRQARHAPRSDPDVSHGAGRLAGGVGNRRGCGVRARRAGPEEVARRRA